MGQGLTHKAALAVPRTAQAEGHDPVNTARSRATCSRPHACCWSPPCAPWAGCRRNTQDACQLVDCIETSGASPSIVIHESPTLRKIFGPSEYLREPQSLLIGCPPCMCSIPLGMDNLCVVLALAGWHHRARPAAKTPSRALAGPTPSRSRPGACHQGRRPGTLGQHHARLKWVQRHHNTRADLLSHETEDHSSLAAATTCSSRPSWSPGSTQPGSGGSTWSIASLPAIRCKTSILPLILRA